MNPQGPVLRDILLPRAAWWPPALGWWLLALVVVVLCVGVLAWVAWRRRRRPLRAALRELDALAAAHATADDPARFAEDASRLMRRVAHRVDPAAASSAGAAWRAFVHRYARNAATREALDSLLARRFQAQQDVDAGAVLGALRAWCRAALGGKPSPAEVQP